MKFLPAWAVGLVVGLIEVAIIAAVYALVDWIRGALGWHGLLVAAGLFMVTSGWIGYARGRKP